MYQRKDVPNKDLEAAIAVWERHMDVYSKATGESISVTTQHMLLLDMCSSQLRYHLKMLDGMRGSIEFPRYAETSRITCKTSSLSEKGGASPLWKKPKEEMAGNIVFQTGGAAVILA